MQRMWSPWRSRHIEQVTADPSYGKSEVFVSIGKHPELDEENMVLWRGPHLYVVMNLYPYNNGHVLIVPYRAVERYQDLDTQEQVEMAATISRCIQWLTIAVQPDGFNIGINIGEAAGAGIPNHLHAHVVPRWSGDTNFMPVTADVKIIPESMQDTFRKLKLAIKSVRAKEAAE